MVEPLAQPIPASPVVDEHVRPLSVGDLLDLGLRLYRRHVRPLFLVALLFEVPVYLAGKAYQEVTRALMPTPGDPVANLPALEHAVTGLLGLLVPLFLVATVLGDLLHGALALAGNEAWHGRPVEAGRMLRAVGRRLPVLVGTSLLVQLLIGGAMIAGALPGAVLAGVAAASGGVLGAVLGIVLAIVGVLVAAVVVYLRFFLWVEATVLEGRAGTGALRRSRELMDGRVAPGLVGRVKVRASLVLLVVFFVGLVPGVVIGIPQFALVWAYAPGPGQLDPASVPLLLQLPLEMLQLLASTLVAPFGVLAGLAFWYDLRVRREGYDLELRASALGARG